MNREELLAAIRKVVGGRKFTFSDDYCADNRTLGAEERIYNGITKKYLYISCRITYGWNADETECGVFFHKYSIYRNYFGRNVDKVLLESLFTSDLEKIYNDMVFYLWWETQRLSKLQKQLDECKKYADMYNKLMNN